MNTKNMWIFVVVILLFLSGSASAQEMVIYPSQGQSTEQMEQDKFRCYTWSKDESGFDPIVIQRLTKKRHTIGYRKGIYGGYQAIMFDKKNGVYYGASESRKDGQAAGY